MVSHDHVRGSAGRVVRRKLLGVGVGLAVVDVRELQLAVLFPLKSVEGRQRVGPVARVEGVVQVLPRELGEVAGGVVHVDVLGHGAPVGAGTSERPVGVDHLGVVVVRRQNHQRREVRCFAGRADTLVAELQLAASLRRHGRRRLAAGSGRLGAGGLRLDRGRRGLHGMLGARPGSRCDGLARRPWAIGSLDDAGYIVRLAVGHCGRTWCRRIVRRVAGACTENGDKRNDRQCCCCEPFAGHTNSCG